MARHGFGGVTCMPGPKQGDLRPQPCRGHLSGGGGPQGTPAETLLYRLQEDRYVWSPCSVQRWDPAQRAFEVLLGTGKSKMVKRLNLRFQVGGTGHPRFDHVDLVDQVGPGWTRLDQGAPTVLRVWGRAFLRRPDGRVQPDCDVSPCFMLRASICSDVTGQVSQADLALQRSVSVGRSD
jgi:hypothetical protein